MRSMLPVTIMAMIASPRITWLFNRSTTLGRQPESQAAFAVIVDFIHADLGPDGSERSADT